MDLDPPQEMRLAADLIGARIRAFTAEKAASPYWAGGDWAEGVNNAMGGAGGELAALFSPNTAAQLSGWLKRTAKLWDEQVMGDRLHVRCDGFIGEDCGCFDFAIGTARSVLNAVGGDAR